MDICKRQKKTFALSYPQYNQKSKVIKNKNDPAKITRPNLAHSLKTIFIGLTPKFYLSEFSIAHKYWLDSILNYKS